MIVLSIMKVGIGSQACENEGPNDHARFRASIVYMVKLSRRMIFAP